MKEVPLSALAGERSHEAVAIALGCSQNAVSKAIRKGRDIRVRMRKGVIVDAYEVGPFPSRREKAAEDQKDAAPGEDDNAVSRQKPD